MADRFGWGILGPGRIATRFTSDLAKLPDARLVAAGSRELARAQAFAGQYSVERAYGSYEALARDEDVQAIYIATPHPFHLDCARLCLEHGKAVLCEKPLAVNARQVRALVDCARANGVFLMEAMWSRFNPAMMQAGAWLREGRIGELRLLTADFGFRTDWSPAGRLLNRELAGGALLDVGTYVVALASWAFAQAPQSVQASAYLGQTGVDEQAAMLLGYPGGAMAQLSCAIRTNTPQEAYLFGTEGWIHLPAFWHATTATLHVAGQEPQTTQGEAGYQFEAAEVMRCVRAGLCESPAMPLDESLAIHQVLDRVRALVGLRYPMD